MYEVFIRLAQKHNTTAYKVSKATGISQQLFSDWKYGRSTPKQDKLKKIADFFGVSVDYLMTGEEKEKTPPVGEVLTEGEQMLIDLFRKVPEDKQQLVLGMIKAALEQI